MRREPEGRSSALWGGRFRMRVHRSHLGPKRPSCFQLGHPGARKSDPTGYSLNPTVALEALHRKL